MGTNAGRSQAEVNRVNIGWQPNSRREYPVKIISSKPFILILFLTLLATIAIAGCGGVSNSPVTTTASTLPGSRLNGQVKGGQQPISGATIQLYQVGTADDGSSAAPLGSSTTTNPSGAFTITGDYTCPGSNPQVYLLATGGNPGLSSGTNNTAIALIAALGSCSSLSSSTFIILNEVTTVAAVAALSPYMTSPTSIGSGTSDASALAAAFTLASQYASTATGTAPGTSVPAGDAVPSTLINSLADIVSACVNSTGGIAGDGSSCGTLFTDSTPSGGAAPTNVATALLNILNNPTSNLTSLFALLPSTPPFESALNAAPSSWAISLFTTPDGGALVDYGTQEQIIRGFGASEVFFGVLPDSQWDELYGRAMPAPTQVNPGSQPIYPQLGLTIMRIQIAPANWDTTTQSVIAGGTSAWTPELTNAYYAQQQYGALIFATPWSPPASMTSNSNVVGGSLLPQYYGQYANYLEAFVNYAASSGPGPNGVNLYAVSMQNEPDAIVDYTSCTWTPTQMDTWVADYGSVLTTGANPVKLIMPESESFNTSYSDPALDDPAAVGNISIIGGHLYGASPFYYTNAENKGKDVWMTEHYLVPTGSGPNGADTVPIMADAIAMAEEIHNSMTVADYNAYVWWEGPNTNPDISPQEHLITSSGVPTYFGLAMSQFSMFIRPGYYRYNATATPVSGVYLSSYSGNGHEVIVVINSTSSSVTLPILIANQTVTSMTPYQTTSSSSVSQLSPVTVTNNQFSATLPAQSVTTYVQ
jgi:glucuronoarabinoxylan endo-1,4-beta-xylanase